jgi:hypothetical protein
LGRGLALFGVADLGLLRGLRCVPDVCDFRH